MFKPTRALMRPVPVSASSAVPDSLYGVTFSNQTILSRTRNNPVRSSTLGQLRLDPHLRDEADDVLHHNIAHTVSQRLRRLKNIPAELWPLGAYRTRSMLLLLLLLLNNVKRLTLRSRCRRWFRCLRRRLLVHPPLLHRQDHPSQASEPCRRRCCCRPPRWRSLSDLVGMKGEAIWRSRGLHGRQM